MRKARGPLLALVLGLAASCASPVRQPVSGLRLEYGGETGEVLRYATHTVLRGRIAMEGMPQLMVVKARAGLTERVLGVEEDGRRRVSREIEIEFLEVNGMRRMVEEKVRRTVSEVLRDASGRIEAARAGSSTLFVSPWLRPLDVFFQLFPEEEVTPGAEWEGSAPASRVVLEGMEDLDGVSCAVLAVRRAGEGAYPEAEVEDLAVSYSGKIHFAPVDGVVRQGRVRGRITGRARVEQMEMEFRMEFTSRLDLLTEE